MSPSPSSVSNKESLLLIENTNESYESLSVLKKEKLIKTSHGFDLTSPTAFPSSSSPFSYFEKSCSPKNSIHEVQAPNLTNFQSPSPTASHFKSPTFSTPSFSQYNPFIKKPESPKNDQNNNGFTFSSYPFSYPNLNASLDSKLTSPILNSNFPSPPTCLPSFQSNFFTINNKGSLFQESGSLINPSESVFRNSSSLPASPSFISYSKKNGFQSPPQFSRNLKYSFERCSPENSVEFYVSTSKTPPLVVLWDTFSKGGYPHDLLLLLYNRFLQLWGPNCEQVSFSIVCTSPRYINENFHFPEANIRWIEASDVAIVTEVLRLSVAGIMYLTVVSENPCLNCALKHLVENGQVKVDWISLSYPSQYPLPSVNFIRMDQFLQSSVTSIFPLHKKPYAHAPSHMNTSSYHLYEGKLKLLTKMVPIAPPPCTNHISLAYVSFGPLYHALQHPSIRERLGPQYDLPIDLSLLGGILKTTMEPFASLKFYLQAAQELGLVKLLHHGSRCLLKVIHPDRLRCWAHASPNSTLISSNTCSTNGSNHTTSNAFNNSAPSSITPPIRLPQRSLNERELAPFLPLLQAFCMARMRYPPPIRTPAIGPLLKPLFAQNQLPWKKLSEYLAEAERQGVIRLNKLGVNGDVQIWICEQACGEVWQSLKQRHGPFREACQEPSIGLNERSETTSSRNMSLQPHQLQQLLNNYHQNNTMLNFNQPQFSADFGDPTFVRSSPSLPQFSLTTTITNKISNPPTVNDVAKLWDQPITSSNQVSNSALPPSSPSSFLSNQYERLETQKLFSDSLAFPFSNTSWMMSKPYSNSNSHSPEWSASNVSVSIKKLPSSMGPLKSEPLTNIYTPWNTPSFLPLECGRSSSL